MGFKESDMTESLNHNHNMGEEHVKESTYMSIGLDKKFRLFRKMLQKHPSKLLAKPIYLMEKEMATHSSILAWEIPRTEEAGGLQAMGSQKCQAWLTTKQQHIYLNPFTVQLKLKYTVNQLYFL